MEKLEKTKSQIESLLLTAYKPVAISALAKFLDLKANEVEKIILELQEEFQEAERGFSIIVNNKKVQLVTSVQNSGLMKKFLKDETTGEMTPASLETLTIVAYRQPVSKAEMEQIRGVNCSLILRNLMIRGLVEANYEKQKGLTVYNVTNEFLKFLGLTSVDQLPDYNKLNSDENLQKLLDHNFQERIETNEEKVVKVEVKPGATG